jgi:excisionase family DNA binding protein
MAATLPSPARPPAVLTIAQVARELQIGRSKAYEMAARGELPVIRLGDKSLRVVRAALNEHLARKLEEAAASR